jgi:Hus1-like protein
MKFRAKMHREGASTLHGVASTLERLAPTAVVYLSEESIQIAIIVESIDMPRCYASMNGELLFLEYRIESQSGNQILFEIALEHLSRALLSGKNAMASQMKLVKRGMTPCLCFEARESDTLSMNVVHDIPIKILRPDDIVYHMPPDIPPPAVALDLPRNSKLMRTIVDKMGRISKHVQLSASQQGRIIFKVEHTTATIKTYYNGLQPRFDGSLDQENDGDNKASVKVDVRKLSMVLNHSSLSIDCATICEYANRYLVVVKYTECNLLLCSTLTRNAST